jgi:hypothetical protein
MKTFTISIDESDSPDYTSFFNFIDSGLGIQYLKKAERGNYSFRSAMTILKSFGALPDDSSKRVWHCVRMMYTKRNPHSVLSYE